MRDIEALARADAADGILQHPLIQEALTDYERTITEAWKNSKPRDAVDREKLHQMLTAQAHFRSYLTQVIVTGKLVRAKTRQSLPERIKEAFR